MKIITNHAEVEITTIENGYVLKYYNCRYECTKKFFANFVVLLDFLDDNYPRINSEEG